MTILKTDSIRTKRTILRRFVETDIDDIANVLGHVDVMQYSLRGPYSREESKEFIDACLSQYQEKGFGLYAIEYSESQKLIGYCGFYRISIDETEAFEISYRLHSDFWNKGLATETTSAIQAYGFETLGFNRMISIIEAENKASIRVAEKIGMKFEKITSIQKTPVQIYAIESLTLKSNNKH